METKKVGHIDYFEFSLGQTIARTARLTKCVQTPIQVREIVISHQDYLGVHIFSFNALYLLTMGLVDRGIAGRRNIHRTYNDFIGTRLNEHKYMFDIYVGEF
jgi:hypothetical protein